MKDKKEGEGRMSRSNKWSSSVSVFIEDSYLGGSSYMKQYRKYT